MADLLIEWIYEPVFKKMDWLRLLPLFYRNSLISGRVAFLGITITNLGQGEVRIKRVDSSSLATIDNAVIQSLPVIEELTTLRPNEGKKIGLCHIVLLAPVLHEATVKLILEDSGEPVNYYQKTGLGKNLPMRTSAWSDFLIVEDIHVLNQEIIALAMLIISVCILALAIKNILSA